MNANAPIWPRKTHELHSHHFELDDLERLRLSRRRHRHWRLRQIPHHLDAADRKPTRIQRRAEDIDVADVSPWLDLRIPPKEVKLPVVGPTLPKSSATSPFCTKRSAFACAALPWLAEGYGFSRGRTRAATDEAAEGHSQVLACRKMPRWGGATRSAGRRRLTITGDGICDF